MFHFQYKTDMRSKKWYWAFKAFHMCNRITSSSFSWFRNSSFHCSKPWIPLEKLTLQISRPITSCWRYFIIPLDRTLFVRKVTAWALIFVMILLTACDSCLPMLKHLATEVASRHSWELDGKHLRCLHYPLGKVQNLESYIHTKKNQKKTPLQNQIFRNSNLQTVLEITLSQIQHFFAARKWKVVYLLAASNQ